MPYRFVPTRIDYSDFAAGRVFVSAPGRPAFPVRLADEILQRCLALRESGRTEEPVTLYDPCCGSGYLLATIAFLHGEKLACVVGSDIASDALELARKNLAMLTMAGIDERIRTLAKLHENFGKASHADALASAARLRERLAALTAKETIRTLVFQVDATNPSDLRANLEPGSIDLVISDVPYGQQTAWFQPEAKEVDSSDPPWRLLEALRPILAAGAVVAIASDKGQRARHEAYQRIDSLQIGKRRVGFFRVGDEAPPRRTSKSQSSKR